MTLAQTIGWSALLGWCMWMIFGPALANAINETRVEVVQASTGAKRTGDNGIHPR